jgi:hypothetical protein
MSTAFFPQGFESYNNTTTQPLTNSYVTWKGTGPYSYPVATTAGNIRPFTNNDPRNNAYYVGTQDKRIYPNLRSGARPLKWQYRKGTQTQAQGPNNPTSLSHSERTSNLIGATIDRPGGYSVKHNPPTEIDGTWSLKGGMWSYFMKLEKQNEIDGIEQQEKVCGQCKSIPLVASFAPEPFLTNNPQPCVTNPQLCCNMPQKAKKMVLPANTNLPKNYYTSSRQYLQNRCQTYEQRAFNFQRAVTNPAAKPGSPQSLQNLYVANCFPNNAAFPYSMSQQVVKLVAILQSLQVITGQEAVEIRNDPKIQSIYALNQFLIHQIPDPARSQEAQQVVANYVKNPYLGMPPEGPSNGAGCKVVVYKPSNYQFACQGGVSSSTRTLKLTVDTINTNITQIRGLKGHSSGQNTDSPFIYKNKAAQCSTSTNTTMIRGTNKSRSGCLKSREATIYKALSKLGTINSNPIIANNNLAMI